MLSVPQLRVAARPLPEATVHTAELLMKWGEGGRGAGLSQPQGPSVSPCYRQMLALSCTGTDLGGQQCSNCRNPRSALSSPTSRVPSGPLGATALGQRGDSLGMCLSQASLAAPLLCYPSCSL